MNNFILRDHTGEIIYHDGQTGHLVRSSGKTSSLEIRPVYYDGSSLKIIRDGSFVPLEQFHVRQEEVASGIERISISQNGFFGASLPGVWQLHFNRTVVAGWETFRCEEYPFDNSQRDFAQETWLSAHDGTLHKKSSIIVTDNGFFISDIYYDILENKKSLEALFNNKNEITLTRGLSTERYIRYNPLIYFVAFGSDEQKEMVAASIHSLIHIGHYNGNLCIITDRDDMKSVVPDDFPGTLHIIKASAQSRIEMWKARYSICDFSFSKNYQPILYMDTDIVCNNQIDHLLSGILTSSKICIGTEDHPGVIIIPSRYRESDAVGKTLFETDNFYPASEYGFNSGIIGFSTVSVAQVAFHAVSNAINRMLQLGMTEGWVDQAVLNYVLHKYGCVDETFLSPKIGVGTGGDTFPYVTASAPSVLIHFWSTHAHERLPRIKKYIEERLREVSER